MAQNGRPMEGEEDNEIEICRNDFSDGESSDRVLFSRSDMSQTCSDRKEKTPEKSGSFRQTAGMDKIHNLVDKGANFIRKRRLSKKKQQNKQKETDGSSKIDDAESDADSVDQPIAQISSEAGSECTLGGSRRHVNGALSCEFDSVRFHRQSVVELKERISETASDKRYSRRTSSDVLSQSTESSSYSGSPRPPPRSKRSKRDPVFNIIDTFASWPYIVAAVLLLLSFAGVPLFICGFLWGVFLACIIFSRLLRIFLPDDEQSNAFNMHFDLHEKNMLPEEESCGAEGIVYRGWMNELEAEYDPHTFHIGATQNVFVRLDKSVLRLCRPRFKVPRHAFWDEDKRDSAFVSQRIYDITGAEVLLRPKHLARRRWWCRKYPICIVIRAQQTRGQYNKSASEGQLADVNVNNDSDKESQKSFCSTSQSYTTFSGDADPKRAQSTSSPPAQHSSADRIIYLFARAHREKEFWFHRLRTAACFYSSQHPELERNVPIIAEEHKATSSISGTKTSNEKPAAQNAVRQHVPINELLEQVEILVHRDDTISPDGRQQQTQVAATTSSETEEDGGSSMAQRRKRSSSGSSTSGQQSTEGFELLGASYSDEFLLYAGIQRQFARYMAGILQPPATGGTNLLLPKGPVCSCDLGSIAWKSDARAPLPSNSNADVTVLWLNSLLARMFWDFTRDPSWIQKMQDRVQRKLSAIKLPYFIQTLMLSQLEPGFIAPKITWVGNPILNEWGLWIDMKMEYSGGMKLVLETKINLMKLKTEAKNNDTRAASSTYSDDEVPLSLESSESSDDESSNPISKLLRKDNAEDSSAPSASPKESTGKKIIKFVDKVAQSKYFQDATDNRFVKKVMQGISDTPLILMVEVKYFEGVMSINIPPPPTDRLWYGFRAKPLLTLRAYPKVGEKAVSVAPVTEWIEAKMKKVFEKNMIVPNMDDLVVPFMRNSPLLSAYNM